ncbi:MAG: hypothetical protein JXA67_19080 [Micromonosporaceae bacterium]|nr:hypothetical protein [Micromonosporaceae bacterium]
MLNDSQWTMLARLTTMPETDRRDLEDRTAAAVHAMIRLGRNVVHPFRASRHALGWSVASRVAEWRAHGLSHDGVGFAVPLHLPHAAHEPARHTGHRVARANRTRPDAGRRVP